MKTSTKLGVAGIVALVALTFAKDYEITKELDTYRQTSIVTTDLLGMPLFTVYNCRPVVNGEEQAIRLGGYKFQSEKEYNKFLNDKFSFECGEKLSRNYKDSDLFPHVEEGTNTNYRGMYQPILSESTIPGTTTSGTTTSGTTTSGTTTSGTTTMGVPTMGMVKGMLSSDLSQFGPRSIGVSTTGSPHSLTGIEALEAPEYLPQKR